jgi:hypothetical protein
MLFTERGLGDSSNEHQQSSYFRAIRLEGDRPSGRIYLQLQSAIAEVECDLSVYRFRLDAAWHIAVLGETPLPSLDEMLTALLASGDPVSVPLEVANALATRRSEAIRYGPWVEGHYRYQQ